ncbi:hypothetical protein [Klebsiella aerogenes]|uniref:hypothetical protein n=1 Tax=Klebsiella aerogenes TaxID=548 RepID=UPI00351D48B0
MTQQTTEQQATGQTTTDPDYIPHDTGMDNFDDATMETEQEQSTTTEPAETSEPDDEQEEVDDNDNTDDQDDEQDETDGGPADAGNVFMFDDEEVEAGEPVQETAREKALREELEQLRKQQREQAPEEQGELTEPGLYDPGIDGDPQKHEAAMRAFYKEQGKREALAEREQQEQESRRQAEHARIEANVKVYGERLAAAKATLPDIDAADDLLGRELPQLHQTALFSAGVENPELVAYALYKNKALREAFTREQNPFRLGMMIADIGKRAQLAPKGKPKPLNKEPKPKGSLGAHPNRYGLTGDLADAVIE